MTFANRFLHCYFSDFSITAVVENDKEFNCEISATTFSPKDLNEIEEASSFLLLNDSLILTIVFGEADPISYFSVTHQLQEFINSLNQEYLHQVGEPINISLIITKKAVENNISIYDLNVFILTLEKLSIAETFVIFTRIFLEKTCVVFTVLNLNHAFNTSTIFFIPASGISPHCQFEERGKRIENLRTVGYYSNFEEHQLVPEDFKIIVENENYKALAALFNVFCVALSIIYLFDITTLNGNELDFKINGYKSIKGAVDINNGFAKGIEEYFSIYSWVYTGGNLNDKIGLARNIISLHFSTNGDILLQGSPFQSIQSSYKVYEKQNIKQYIEIRNKISDQLLDFNNRANKLIETFASGFQKSALALISFYISAIAIRVLSKGDFTNVFSFDATILSTAFVIGSFIYFFVSRWEVKEQRKRFESSYTNLKERYTDLLDKEDIQRILNNDAEFNADIDFIDKKLKTYSRMWIGFLLILFLTTIILFLTYNLSQLFDTPFGKLLFNNKCHC